MFFASSIGGDSVQSCAIGLPQLQVVVKVVVAMGWMEEGEVGDLTAGGPTTSLTTSGGPTFSLNVMDGREIWVVCCSMG